MDKELSYKGCVPGWYAEGPDFGLIPARFGMPSSLAKATCDSFIYMLELANRRSVTFSDAQVFIREVDAGGIIRCGTVILFPAEPFDFAPMFPRGCDVRRGPSFEHRSAPPPWRPAPREVPFIVSDRSNILVRLEDIMWCADAPWGS